MKYLPIFLVCPLEHNFSEAFLNPYVDAQGVEKAQSDDLQHEQSSNEESIHEMETESEVDFATVFLDFWLSIICYSESAFPLCKEN